ncbi:hypothetical protein BH10CYA1_BH10CYA1_50180 [soil metagenome]
MPSDFNRKGSQNKNEQEHVNTLGNPLASEEEWLHANDKLGDFKPKPTATDQSQKRSRHIGEVVILAAMGLGVFGLINFTQPTNFHKVTKPASVGTVPASKTQAAGYDVDFGPYMADLQRSIKHNWSPPKNNESKRVVVIFQVSKEVRVSKLRLDRSSGVATVDQAALKAVGNAEPEFGALPEGAPEFVDIQFTFDYNVWNNKNETDADHSDHN